MLRDVYAYNQVLNHWHLTFPFPVLAALLPIRWRQPWMAAYFLLSTGCHMSKPELPSLSLIILTDMSVASNFPAWLSVWFPWGDHCLPSAQGGPRHGNAVMAMGMCWIEHWKRHTWLPAWGDHGVEGLTLHPSQFLALGGCDMEFLAGNVFLACLAAFQLRAVSYAPINCVFVPLQ